jgi:AcrR family transcriptional regulator
MFSPDAPSTAPASSAPPPAGGASSEVPGGRDRVLAAAFARVAEHGAAGASVRAIAGDAGVSPALVLHHFGSKDGLLAACDAHLADLLLALKSDAMARGPGLDVAAAVAAASTEVAPLGAYLARRLVEGGAAVTELVDRLVADAHGYVRTGIERGLVRPSARERERTVLLTLWSLGALALHRHAGRLLGYDPTDGPEALARWSALATEVLATGILTPAALAGGIDAEAGAHGAAEEGRR